MPVPGHNRWQQKRKDSILQRGVSTSHISPSEPRLLPPCPSMNAADLRRTHQLNGWMYDLIRRKRQGAEKSDEQDTQETQDMSDDNPSLLFPNIGIWNCFTSNVRNVMLPAYQRFRYVIQDQIPWESSKDGPSIFSADTNKPRPTFPQQVDYVLARIPLQTAWNMCTVQKPSRRAEIQLTLSSPSLDTWASLHDSREKSTSSFLSGLIKEGSVSDLNKGLHRFSSVQLRSRVWLFATPWTAARQASLSITNSRSLLKLMSIESVMPSNHLILCRPLLLLPQSLPASGSFPMSQLFAWGGQSTGVSASDRRGEIKEWKTERTKRK